MHVWYDSATRRVQYLSAAAFTATPPPGQAIVELDDAPLPGPVEQLRLTAELAALEVDPALIPPALADGPAFIAAVMAVFGTPARIKEVWVKQPVWYPSAEKGNWPFVQAFTADALASGDITQAEYDAIKAAAAAHHIPITL